MRRLIAAAALLLLPVLAFSQPLPAPDEGAGAVDERLQLAISDGAYPVTPGDVYELTFLQGVELVTTQVIVESTYRLNLGIFGTVDARGMTFAELKPEVERIIANAYPRGLPSLNITAVGLFRVALAGSIPRSTRVTAWGLSRLTDLISGNTGPLPRYARSSYARATAPPSPTTCFARFTPATRRRTRCCAPAIRCLPAPRTDGDGRRRSLRARDLRASRRRRPARARRVLPGLSTARGYAPARRRAAVRRDRPPDLPSAHPSKRVISGSRTATCSSSPAVSCRGPSCTWKAR